jgi:ABC-type sugar transport system ATPase subunit
MLHDAWLASGRDQPTAELSMTATVPPSPPVLAIGGLSKRFPGIVALDDVSFDLRAGEIHAVIGQNGAGKSTMINVISGMLAPDSGEIRLAGAPVTIDSTRRANKLGIATVHQDLSLLPNLTVAQNIALGREPRRFGLLDMGAMRAMSDAALARLGLNIPADLRVGSLSLAERQLVEIAKALAHDPKVLILDEPTAPLGKREAERLFEILRGLKRQGIGIVYVSHRFGEIINLCDRATVLRNGRVATTTGLKGWGEAELTEAMVGGRSDLYRSAGGRTLGSTLLEAKNLAWRNRVRNVSLTVSAGEILALTGLLGAGQNEIARILGGHLRAEAGTVAVNERAMPIRGSADAARAGLCLLTDDRQQEGILANLPLRANIALPSLARRRRAGLFVSGPAERSAVAAAIESFGIVARSLEMPIRTLSGGNQQKALIARWHLADAKIFVLIEPTRGVDVAARAEIYRRLEALARAGKALIVVSSDIPEVLALADRILVVRDGRIAAETEPARTDEERLNLLVQGAQ